MQRARLLSCGQVGKEGREGGREGGSRKEKGVRRNGFNPCWSRHLLTHVFLVQPTHPHTHTHHADLKGNIPHWVFSKSVGTTGMHFLQTLEKLTKGKGK